MKKLRSLFALLMCLMMVFTIAPISGIVPMVSAETQTGTCGESLTWSLDTETGILEIAGSGAMTNWSGVTKTPWNAYRPKIKTVHIGDGVTNVGNFAFFNTSSIESVAIGDSVKSIGVNAFSSCKIKSIFIPKTVKNIEDNAFFNCGNLKTVYYTGTEEEWNAISFTNGNDSLKSAEIKDNHKHSYGETVTTEPTCTTVGVAIFTCKCGDAFIEEVEKLEHDWVEKTTPSTCKEQGSKYNECSVCKETKEIEKLPLAEHKMETKTTESTCTVKGSKYDECTVCGEKTKAEELPLADHKTEHKTTDSTCSAAGSEYDECTVCGEKLNVKELPKAEHTWGKWEETKAPTYEADGEETRECTVCGEKETRDIPKDDSFSSQTTELISLINTKNGPKLTWKAVEGAEGYYVYYKTRGEEWSCFDPVTETSFTDVNAESGTEYTYSVRAFNGSVSTEMEDGLTIKYLASPAVFAVSNTTAGATVSWNPVSGVSKYYIYRRTVDGTYKNVGNSTTTRFTDKTAETGTKYYYTVRAGYGKALSSYHAGKGLIYVETPVVSSVVNTTLGAKIVWNTVDGASKYYVYRKTANTEYKNIGDTTSENYTDATAISGTKYYYTVKAVYEKTLSSYNAGKGLVYITAPTVSAVTNTTAGVKITWSKVGGASNYNVYRKTADGSYARVGTTTGTTFTDSTAKSGTTYYYTVRANKGSVLSSYRAGKGVKFLTAPTVASVTSRTDGARIAWGKIAGASGYYVYRKTAGGSYTVIGTTTATNFTDKTAKKGTTYYYTVRAYNNSVLSSYRAGKKA